MALGAAREIWALARSPMTTMRVSGAARRAFFAALETEEWIPPQRPESEVMAMTRTFPSPDWASEFLKSSVGRQQREKDGSDYTVQRAKEEHMQKEERQESGGRRRDEI